MGGPLYIGALDSIFLPPLAIRGCMGEDIPAGLTGNLKVMTSWGGGDTGTRYSAKVQCNSV